MDKLSNGGGRFILSHRFLHGSQLVAVGKQKRVLTHMYIIQIEWHRNSTIKLNKLIAI